MSNLWKPLRRALLAVVVLSLAACEAGDGPLTPEQDTDLSLTVTVNGVQLVKVDPAKKGLFLAASTTAERVSAQDGATITTDDADLNVEPGSIPDDTTITVKPLDDGTVAFKFGPSGLQFDPAATLTISADKADLDGIATSDLAIAGASDDADDWQVIGGTYDSATNTVTVDIHHFSRYSLCLR